MKDILNQNLLDQLLEEQKNGRKVIKGEKIWHKEGMTYMSSGWWYFSPRTSKWVFFRRKLLPVMLNRFKKDDNWLRRTSGVRQNLFCDQNS